MVNNGTLHYDHDRDGTHTQLAGCEAKLRNFDHDTHIAIRYEFDTISGKLVQASFNGWENPELMRLEVPNILSV